MKVDLPTGFETGYPGKEQDRWCVHRAGAKTTLCRRRVSTALHEGYFPTGDLMPSDEATGHRACLQRLAELTAPGVCPVCGETVPQVDGRIGEHGGCPGVNMAPRGER